MMIQLWNLIFIHVTICTINNFVYSRDARLMNTNSTSNRGFTNDFPQIWYNIRLPVDVIPYHYNLYINADVDRLRFDGQQIAFINILKPTNTVIFHTKELVVQDVSLVSIPKRHVYKISRHFPYSKNEYHVVLFQNALPLGKYALAIEFSGNVSEKLTGFYKSSYEENGVEQVLLTTKFQPTDARKAFPCFDEPDMKATFDISIRHSNTYIARSNMPAIETSKSTDQTSKNTDKASDNIDQWRTTKFRRTVKMSTYLVAYVVSKFKSKFEGMSGIDNHVKLAIWSRPEYVNITEYAFNTSMSMLPYIEKFMGFKYPMPKLDMYAIPDYGSGATEHWGIITYRESKLLFKPGTSSNGTRYNIASIIAHEIAHLWFGNLVTCKWWNDLWVQEGMASYMEYYLLDHAHPKWKVNDDFLTFEIIPGMKLDALLSSHPLSQPLHHPKQIKEIFDKITYRKGASLFGMLDSFLGTEVFKRGLNIYLRTYQYKGATVEQLWNSFSQVADMNIKKMMDTWTLQMGFPCVTIKRENKDTFSITQQRFLLDPKAQTKDQLKYLWIIPFVYATSGDLHKAEVTVLKEKTTKIKSSANWFVGNYGHKGFYRVNYDEEGWNYIIETLNKNHTEFTASDRAGILDDAFSLARSSLIPYSIPFRLLEFLRVEESSVVWTVVVNNFGFLDTVLRSQDYYGAFRQKYAALLKKEAKKKESSSFSLQACRVGEENTVSVLQNLFKKWMENGTLIPENIRRACYFCAVANGADKEWDFVYKMYRKATNPSEKSNLLFALSATEKPWILNKWLRYSIDPTKVKSQDMVYVLKNIAKYNTIGKVYAWEFAENNWKKLMDVAKDNNFHVNVLISGLTSRFTTPADLQKVNKLWDSYDDKTSGMKAKEQAIEYIKTNIDWLERNSDQVSRLFLLGN